VNIDVVHLYISDGHNFFGRHGQAADAHTIREVDSVHCLAGRGIEGDRFCDFKNNYKGQITFFASEVYEALREECGVFDVAPFAFRRNVITRGIDLNDLIGERFEIQGVAFEGTEECRPCHWMNFAFHPEAEKRLRGRGGLRAKILTTGIISSGS
jgi:MOSC domain-containing protein YiiM